MDDSDLRRRFATIDAESMTLSVLLTTHMTSLDRRLEAFAEKLEANREEMHKLGNIIVTQNVRETVVDHEGRLRAIEVWKATMIGRISVYSLLAATVVSVAVQVAVKLAPHL